MECATCHMPAEPTMGKEIIARLDDYDDWPCQIDDEVLVHLSDRSLADWHQRSVGQPGGFMPGRYLGVCSMGEDAYPPCTNCGAKVGIGGAFATIEYPKGFEAMSHDDDGTWADDRCKRPCFRSFATQADHLLDDYSR